MPLESQFTEEQLFDSLVSSLVHSVWVALGKIKNPMTDKVERSLPGASMNIDMLDMLYKRMDGNLNEQEETYLSRILSELKMNYIEEKKIGNEQPEEIDKAENKEEKPKAKSETKAKPKTDEPKTKKPNAKKTAPKTKDKK